MRTSQSLSCAVDWPCFPAGANPGLMKKYIVRLTDEDRKICEETIGKLKGISQKARRARILLQVNANVPNWTDQLLDKPKMHTKGAFYAAFKPSRVRELVRRIEYCCTQKHGSWQNITENELSVMTRQCLSARRIGDSEGDYIQSSRNFPNSA